MYKRIININELVKEKSVLLLGPRQSGKSTLVQSIGKNSNQADASQIYGGQTSASQIYGNQSSRADYGQNQWDEKEAEHTRYINLAQSEVFRTLSANPERLRQQLDEKIERLIIDEAQLLPEIFNEVQTILDRNKSFRVILTGSSARKLRRSGINLLPGRIWRRELHPLVSQELQCARIEERVIKGSLPGIIDSTNYKEELINYVGLYLEEEIRAESITRSVGNFSRFLNVAALANSEQLNYSNIANDSGIKINTVRNYFEILKDTLIGFELEPLRATSSRKSVSIPKFYFFDIGVVNGILNRFELIPGSESYGKALEHLVFLELKAYIDYCRRNSQLNYWRTYTQHEVDFVVNGEIGIEVKSSQNISPRDEKPLIELSKDFPIKRRIIICREATKRISDLKTEIIPVDQFLVDLWNGDIW